MKKKRVLQVKKKKTDMKKNLDGIKKIYKEGLEKNRKKILAFCRKKDVDEISKFFEKVFIGALKKYVCYGSDNFGIAKEASIKFRKFMFAEGKEAFSEEEKIAIRSSFARELMYRENPDFPKKIQVKPDDPWGALLECSVENFLYNYANCCGLTQVMGTMAPFDIPFPIYVWRIDQENKVEELNLITIDLGDFIVIFSPWGFTEWKDVKEGLFVFEKKKDGKDVLLQIKEKIIEINNDYKDVTFALRFRYRYHSRVKEIIESKNGRYKQTPVRKLKKNHNIIITQAGSVLFYYGITKWFEMKSEFNKIVNSENRKRIKRIIDECQKKMFKFLENMPENYEEHNNPFCIIDNLDEGNPLFNFIIYHAGLYHLKNKNPNCSKEFNPEKEVSVLCCFYYYTCTVGKFLHEVYLASKQLDYARLSSLLHFGQTIFKYDFSKRLKKHKGLNSLHIAILSMNKKIEEIGKGTKKRTALNFEDNDEESIRRNFYKIAKVLIAYFGKEIVREKDKSGKSPLQYFKNDRDKIDFFGSLGTMQHLFFTDSYDIKEELKTYVFTFKSKLHYSCFSDVTRNVVDGGANGGCEHGCFCEHDCSCEHEHHDHASDGENESEENEGEGEEDKQNEDQTKVLINEEKDPEAFDFPFDDVDVKGVCALEKTGEDAKIGNSDFLIVSSQVISNCEDDNKKNDKSESEPDNDEKKIVPDNDDDTGRKRAVRGEKKKVLSDI